MLYGLNEKFPKSGQPVNKPLKYIRKSRHKATTGKIVMFMHDKQTWSLLLTKQWQRG